MKCLSCGGELVCNRAKKIKWKTLFGRKGSSLTRRSKMARTWLCKNCGKVFTVRLQLVEVELA